MSPSAPWTRSAGKHWSQTWNSVTTPEGVMRPMLFATRFGLPMNDSVNQKLPALARMMWSGLRPTVGTLNCLSLSGGAADADVAIVVATTVTTTIDSTVRTRRVMFHSRVELCATRRAVGDGSTCDPSWALLRVGFGCRADHRQSELATTDGIWRPGRE